MLIIRQCILVAAFSLGGCITGPALQDSEAAALAETISSEAGRHYAGLSASAAPQCDYNHSMNTYAHLKEIAGQLSARLAERRASAALLRAADALSRTIEQARLSHQLASARTDDASGACLAPGAIALNADAIVRASRAIANTQLTNGGL